MRVHQLLEAARAALQAEEGGGDEAGDETSEDLGPSSGELARVQGEALLLSQRGLQASIVSRAQP